MGSSTARAERPLAYEAERRSAAPPVISIAPGLFSNILLIVPTLDEENGLPLVLSQARQLGIAVVVADAGSTDRTREIASEFDTPVLNVPRGKGRGWRELLARLDYTSWEYLAMVDGDATYDLQALPRMLEHRADMVIGLRKALPGATTWVRGLGDVCFSELVSLFTGRDCPDLLSGFRIMRSSCLQRIFFTSSNFELETELTIRFLRRGFSVEWVDTEYRSRLGRSKLHVVKDGWRILRAIVYYSTVEP